MRITYTLLDSDKHIYRYNTSSSREGKCILPSSIYFNVLKNSNNDICGIVPYIDFLDDNINTLDYLFFYLSSTDDVTVRQDLYNKFSRVVPCYKPYYIQSDVDSFDLDLSVTNFVIDWDSNIFGFPVIGDDFDDKGLYSELLYNAEQANMAESFLIDTDPNKELDPDFWSDKYLAFCKFVEEYNKNVLLLRSTRKVNIENTISTTSTDSSSDINLSGIENKLQSISDKLQTTEIIDNSQKSITDVLNQQSNTIQVDEIGLLRSKKGYY